MDGITSAGTETHTHRCAYTHNVLHRFVLIWAGGILEKGTREVLGERIRMKESVCVTGGDKGMQGETVACTQWGYCMSAWFYFKLFKSLVFLREHAATGSWALQTTKIKNKAVVCFSTAPGGLQWILFVTSPALHAHHHQSVIFSV